jgi:hypothetical protein
MNFLDVIILILILGFLLNKKFPSALYYLARFAGWAIGYLIGLSIAINIAKNMTSDDEIGKTTLGLMFGLALLFEIIVVFIAKRLIIKITNPKFVQFDSKLSIPCRLLTIFLTIFILSQSLLYIPITWVQFSAQGSGFIMMQARIFPDTIIAETAGKLSPDRFANLPPIFSMGKVKKVDTSVADDFKNVVDRISPSIVRIVAIKCFGKMGGSGSGSVVGDGLVVTNAHVVEGSSEIYIESQNGIYPANSIVIDEAHDVAVIYSKYFNLEPIPISSQDPETGSRLIALGYPGGGELSMSIGTASKIGYDSALHDGLKNTDLISFSGHLGQGSSGGPVVNKYGEIVAINAAGGTIDIKIKGSVVKKIVDDAKFRPFPQISMPCTYQASSW